MILQDIKSGTQGLNEDQQAIAAACVREGLLSCDGGIDDSDNDGDDGSNDDSDNGSGSGRFRGSRSVVIVPKVREKCLRF